MVWGYESDTQRLKEINDSIEAMEKCEKEYIQSLEEQISNWEYEIKELKEHIKENNQLIKQSYENFKQQSNFLIQQKLNYEHKLKIKAI
jgi:TolA-binding protein